MLLSAALLVAIPLVNAAPWAQPLDAPAHALFKRQETPGAFDASKYPAVGVLPPASSVPQEWLDKLASVQIADVPVATVVPNTENQVTYPTGTDLQSKEVCAYSTGCMRDDDIFSLPAGVFGITFDDGPGDGTQTLSDFLETKNMSTHATHFFIGGQIVRNTPGFELIFNRGGHIAGHTWSHPRLTAHTNEEIVAELGWTMQVIYDLSGGRIPQFWRPPFGDLDERVRDIAKNVFGLKTALWNSDTNDWKIAAEGKQVVEVLFDQWAAGPKDVGHNVLMHEVRLPTIEVFISKYDLIEQNGWKIQNLAESVGEPMYANSPSNDGPVEQMSLLGAAGDGSSAPPPAQSSASNGGSANTSAGPSASSNGATPTDGGAPPTDNNANASAAPAPNSGSSALAPSILVSAIALFASALF